MTDYDAIRTLMPELVPFVKTLGVDYEHLDATTAVCALRDEPSFHNHVGGLHAGTMFTVGETASGALVLANFEDLLREGITPLPATATMTFARIAQGRVTATATMQRDAADVRAELAETGKTVRFDVEVVLTADAGETGRMTVTWALRPPR